MIDPRADKVTIRELADDLKAEYAATGRRSLDRLQFSLAHLLPALGDHRVVRLSTAQITAYTVTRREAGAANATINRELAALKRMLRLALQGEKIHRAPYIPMLKEDNVRKGFFELEQFDAVRHHLPADLQALATSPTLRAGGPKRSRLWHGLRSIFRPGPSCCSWERTRAVLAGPSM